MINPVVGQICLVKDMHCTSGVFRVKEVGEKIGLEQLGFDGWVDCGQISRGSFAGFDVYQPVPTVPPVGPPIQRHEIPS